MQPNVSVLECCPAAARVIGARANGWLDPRTLLTVEHSADKGYWLSLHTPDSRAEESLIQVEPPGSEMALPVHPRCVTEAVLLRSGDLCDPSLVQLLAEAAMRGHLIYCRTEAIAEALRAAWTGYQFRHRKTGEPYALPEFLGLPAWRWHETPPYEPPALHRGIVRPQTAHRVGRPSLLPLSRDGCICCPSDRIHKATVEALAPGAMQPISSARLEEFGILGSHAFWRGCVFDSNPKKRLDVVYGVIGFPTEPDPEVQTLLSHNPGLAVKAQYALWARIYAEVDTVPGAFITQTVSQFCDDLSFARHHSGAHRPERKRQALRVMGLLSALEVRAVYVSPTGHVSYLSGPVWSRRVADGAHGPADARQPVAPPAGDATLFTYAPGPYFTDDAWRRYNRRVAMVGAGLLELRSDLDRGAILVAGYLATRARMGGYAPVVARVQVLLSKTGLAGNRSRPGRALDQLEIALDRCVEAGVIAGWEFAGTDSHEPDMDDSEELAGLWLDARDRQTRSVIIQWPPDLAARSITLQKRQAAALGRAREGKPERTP